MVKIGFQTFPSGKQYLFYRDGDKRIFLRNIMFIKNARDPKQIVVVREWGAKSNREMWEPPKGQMEWKEVAAEGVRPNEDISFSKLSEFMREGVLREVMEEAKIMPDEIRHLHLTAPYYRAPFPKAGRDAFFHYAFWEAELTDLRPAQKRMQQLVKNPDWAAMLPADVCEKNAVTWWSPADPSTKHWIRGAFSGEMVRMYVGK